MARYKKNTNLGTSMPSLFDSIDISTGLEDRMPQLDNLDLHIKSPKKDFKSDKSHTIAPLDDIKNPEQIYLLSFGSGSSGNSTYIGTRDNGVLIDAGVDNKKVEKELLRNGIDISAVKGILLTHDHGDHIRYAYSLLRNHKELGLYCTPKVLNGILRRHNISRRIKDYHRPIYKEFPFQLGGLTVTAFEVDHDGTDNAGFFIQKGNFCFTLATDLGSIGQRVDYYMRQASHIMIETNYDLGMLQRGRYPEYLKARIVAANGHLDNKVTAAYLANIYHSGIQNIFLCHLSQDNNTPEIAITEVTAAFNAIGVSVGDCSNSPESLKADVQLMTLPRFDSTGLILLERL